MNRSKQQILGLMGARPYKITGSYQLVDYDDNLDHFLNSLGINGTEYGPAFRRTKVRVFVREPTKHNKKWSLIHKEEGNTDPDKSLSYTFEPGKATTIETEDESTEKVVCLNKATNLILCQTEVKQTGWSVESRIMFTSEGITATYVNTQSGVVMSAKYARLVDPWSSKKKSLLRKIKY